MSSLETLPALQGALTEPNQEIDLRRAWQTIARSAWIIVVCIFLAVAAAVVAARRVEPTWSAAATVRVDEKKAESGPGGALAYFNADNQTSLAMATEVITSRSVASEAVDSLGLRLSVVQPVTSVRSRYIASVRMTSDAPSIGYRIVRVTGGREVHALLPNDSLLGVYPDSAELRIIGGTLTLTGDGRALDRFTLAVDERVPTAEALRGSVAVNPTNKDANILSISYTGKDSVLAREIPNTLSRLFVHRRMQLDKSGASARVEYLTKQLAALNVEVTDAEQAIKEYLVGHGITGVQAEQAALGQQLAQLENAKRELEQTKENISRALEPLALADTVRGRQLFLQKLLATPDFQRSGIAGGDVNRYEQLLTQRSSTSLRLTASTREIRDLDTQIRETQETIRKRVIQYLSNIDEQVAALKPRIAQTQTALNKVPEQLIEYSKLERNRRIVEEMITLVQAQLKQSEIAQAVQDSTASVLDEAVQPNSQVGTSETLIFAVAVLSGLIVGVSVAFLRDWLDTTIRTEHDLANIVGVAVVGIIPNLQQQARSVGYRLPTPKDGDDSKPAAGREYQTPAAEAYRTLRTNLNYLTPPRPPHVIVVTSALPGDGKTTTVVNLAVTLAHQGQRVILIDAETRRGTVHDVFGIPPAPGFFDLMYGQASPGECIRRVQMEGGGTIDVLPLGSAPSVNPADLLVAARLQPLFERLRAQYDYVLIDTPPLNLFTDAALIGAHADALLLVARADKTDRDELKFAVQQLRNVQVTLAGTILNDVEFRRSSRYRLGYGYYYDYAR
jgi:tyrosine-protein kinase Etk/Wzc